MPALCGFPEVSKFWQLIVHEGASQFGTHAAFDVAALGGQGAVEGLQVPA